MAPAATASSRSRSASDTVSITIRVCSPHVLATLMPPPLGMWRSHTTRSGEVAPMTSIASSASLASPTTWKLEPRSARTPERQIGWSSASTTRTSWRSATGGVSYTHSRTSVPRPGFPSISTRPPTSATRSRTDRRRPIPSGCPGWNPCPSSFTEQNTPAPSGSA